MNNIPLFGGISERSVGQGLQAVPKRIEAMTNVMSPQRPPKRPGGRFGATWLCPLNRGADTRPFGHYSLVIFSKICFPMITACSFLPAATHMIQALQLEDQLVGVTFECPSDKPAVVRSHLEGNHLSSAEIDKLDSAAARNNESLYFIDVPLLERLAPDLVFTQHVCDVCQIGTSYVEKAIFSLPRPPKVVPLVPRRLADVTENARGIARELGHADAGERLVAATEARIAAVVDRLRADRLPPRRVMVME